MLLLGQASFTTLIFLLSFCVFLLAWLFAEAMDEFSSSFKIVSLFSLQLAGLWLVPLSILQHGYILHELSCDFELHRKAFAFNSLCQYALLLQAGSFLVSAATFMLPETQQWPFRAAVATAIFSSLFYQLLQSYFYFRLRKER